MPSGLDFLRNGIKVLRERECTFDSRHFIDPGALRDLCTADVISDAVKDCLVDSYERDQITNDILENGIITFCILVFKRHERFLQKFLECDPHGARDTRLPLDKKVLLDIAEEAASDFYEAQWEFRPVILVKHKYLQLATHHILPFSKDEHDEERDGSFGAIHRVLIKTSMQKLIDSKEPTVKVIRKQLRLSGNTEGFERERRCLGVLQTLKHDNIVELLCSYTYREKHSLVFKCEDMNLDEFLSLEERYKDFTSDVAFYRALYGLASAIHYIHSCDIGGEDESKTIIGYHHDIRPHNILIRRNTFVLADFGLAKIEERDNTSSSYKGGGGDYIAPECLMKGARIKCAADIWSLGGVIIDIASYMQGGPKARATAQELRESDGPYPGVTNCFFFDNGRVKSAVRETIETLQNNPKDKTTRTLLKLSEFMLQIQPDSRPDANVVRDNTAYISLKSLFRSALEAMIQWKRQSQEPGPGRIWEDTWKLWAWGEEVGMNGVRLVPEIFQNALRDGDKTAKNLENHLVDLVNRLSSQINDQGSDVPKLWRRSTDTSVTDKSDNEDKINVCIRDLRRALPEGYRTRIEERKAYYGQFATMKPLGLPTVSDETIQPPKSGPASPLETSISDSSTSSKASLRAITTPDNEESIFRNDSIDAYENGNDTPIQSVKGKKRTSTTATSATNTPASWHSTETSAGPSSSQLQSAITTPSTQGSSRMDFNKPLPSRPPSAQFLPQPAVDIRSPLSGPSRLTRSTLSAKISFPQGRDCCEHNRDIKVAKVLIYGFVRTNVLCHCKECGVELRHEIRISAFSYPHMEHPSGDLGDSRTVTFFGPQTLSEPTQSNLDGNSIVTLQICYTFTNPRDCDTFREDVWGKKLLRTAGVKSISWAPLAEASTLRLTLWQEWSESRTFSIAFRAMKEASAHPGHDEISLDLASPKPVGKYDHKHLHLLIAPEALTAHIPAPRKKSHQKLKVTFDHENDSNTFKNILTRTATP